MTKKILYLTEPQNEKTNNMVYCDNDNNNWVWLCSSKNTATLIIGASKGPNGGGSCERGKEVSGRALQF